MEGSKKERAQLPHWTVCSTSQLPHHSCLDTTIVLFPSALGPSAMCSGRPPLNPGGSQRHCDSLRSCLTLKYLGRGRSCNAKRWFHPVSLLQNNVAWHLYCKQIKLALLSECGDHLIIINSEQGNNGYEQTLHQMPVFSENRSPRNFQLKMVHWTKTVAPTLLIPLLKRDFFLKAHNHRAKQKEEKTTARNLEARLQMDKRKHT